MQKVLCCWFWHVFGKKLQIYLKLLLCSLIFSLCRVCIFSQYNQQYREEQNNLSADSIAYCKRLDVKTRSSDKPMKTHRKFCFLSHSTKGLKIECQLQIWWKATSANKVCVPRQKRLPQNVICSLIQGSDPLIGATYKCITSMKSPLFCIRPPIFHQLSNTVYISRHKMRNNISDYGVNVSNNSSSESKQPNLNLRFCYLSRDYNCYIQKWHTMLTSLPLRLQKNTDLHVHKFATIVTSAPAV